MDVDPILVFAIFQIFLYLDPDHFGSFGYFGRSDSFMGGFVVLDPDVCGGQLGDPPAFEQHSNELVDQFI